MSIWKHNSIMPDTDRECIFIIKDEYIKGETKSISAWLKFVDAYEDDGEMIDASYWFVDDKEDFNSTIDWIWDIDNHKIEKWAYLDELEGI